MHKKGNSGFRSVGSWPLSAATFVGSFLLFQIQPIMGKRLLPLFGGAARVWSASLLFFQLFLLVGYVYAHLVAKLVPRSQKYVHQCMVFVSLVSVVVMFLRWDSSMFLQAGAATGSNLLSVYQVLRVLFVSIGLPYMLIAAGSPLLQVWYSRTAKGSPYPLYAVSNAASLLALISYPVIVEPFFSLRMQARIWITGYVAYAVLVGWCAIRFALVTRVVSEDSRKALPRKENTRLPVFQHLQWILIAAVPSFMLLAATEHITSNVAAVPLLWIIPLTIYLLTFILSFSGYSPQKELSALLVLLTSLGSWYALKHSLAMPITHQVLLHSATLFTGCTLFHSLLYESRPEPARLTGFYMAIALGGAVGGASMSLAVPLLSSTVWEFHLAIIVLCMAGAGVLFSADNHRMKAWRFPLGAVLILVVSLVWQDYRHRCADSVLSTRNFYGALKVHRQEIQPGGNIFSLMHGNVCHGIQYDRYPRRRIPTAYFYEESGLGLAIRYKQALLKEKGRGIRIGALGMGIGVVSAYCEPGDHVRFYELDPGVVKIAQNRKYFTYLGDCRGTLDIVLGDARVSLERELEEGDIKKFDVVVVDVFNGDAIPVHLLTAEAFSVYLSHLAEDGILALHISNAHLDLSGVVWIAKELNSLHGAIVRTEGDLKLSSNATWALLSRDRGLLKAPSIKEVSLPESDVPVQRYAWTDEYSSILRVLGKATVPRKNRL
ncbi:MAG: fused MFS/spermidine synthase [Kiritimatiellia bacterium]|nr:fused MFS/spermidine synthase [Kiritimatiellia bacterium]